MEGIYALNTLKDAKEKSLEGVSLQLAVSSFWRHLAGLADHSLSCLRVVEAGTALR
jgi:hypothetical protein